MTICRVEHNRNYTTINNTIVKDNRLSWKAKGIWLYAFSRPDDWTFYVSDLINQSTDGKDAVYAGLKELEECGYLQKDQRKKEDGKFTKVDWVFYETPNIKIISPQRDFPDTAFPDTVNPPLTNTEEQPNIEKQQKQTMPACPAAVCSLDNSLSSVPSEENEAERVKRQAFNWFMKIGCDELSAMFFVNTYSPEDIKNASGYVQQQIEKKKIKNERIPNIIGYLRRTLEGRWWIKTPKQS